MKTAQSARIFTDDWISETVHAQACYLERKSFADELFLFVEKRRAVITQDGLSELKRRVQSDTRSIQAHPNYRGLKFDFMDLFSGFAMQTLSGYPHVSVSVAGSFAEYTYARRFNEKYRWYRDVRVEFDEGEKKFDSWLLIGAKRFTTTGEASRELLSPFTDLDFEIPKDAEVES